MERENEYDDLLFTANKRKRAGNNFIAGANSNISAADREYMSGLADNMRAAQWQMQQSLKRLDDWGKSDMNTYYKESQKSFLVPKDSEERRRLQFVTTPKVVDEAIDDYYNEIFAPNLRKQRSEADKRGIEAYKKYAWVPGGDPSLALANMYRNTDPMETIERTMAQSDDGRLDAIAERYAHYAGVSPSDYRKQVLEPALRQRAVDAVVKEKTPKNRGEYLLREMRRNSLVGALGDMRSYGYKGSSHRYIDDAAMENYNPSRGERFTAGVGGLLLDSGIFAGLGTAASMLTGKATNVVMNRAVTKMLANGASKGLTREMAEQTAKNAILGSLKTKILQSSMTQGITLGAYDAAHSVADDILYGEQPNALSAATSFAKGAATGAALGAVGTPLRHASRGLTGGKRLAASAGILGAESAVFTASAEAAKMLQGVTVEPIDLVNDFGESAATLIAMRMFHWRPSGGAEKLNTVGRLKNGLHFSMPEANEIAKSGVNPNEFIANIEKALNVYQKGNGKAAEQVREDYIKLMSTTGLSASTRSKLLYLVENKLSSTPPEAVDYRVDEKGNGRFTFSTFDAEGQPLESVECNSREELESAYFTKTGALRRNRIASHERELMRSYDSQNFFRQAGKYARETGTDVDVLSDAMYRRARNEEMTAEQQGMLDEILRRSNYADSEVGQMLHSIRRSLEQEYNLNEGSLLGAIEKSSFYCSKAENEALNKYERIMAEEVNKLHSGVSDERSNKLSSEENAYTGLGNSELKEQENLDYKDMMIRTGGKINEGSIPTFSEQFGIFSDGIHKPADWDDTYVWNTNNNRHTPKDIDRMAIEVQRLGDKLGSSIEVITDESQIPTSDPEYFFKVRSYGWYDDGTGKVIINLPNNQNVAEVRKTVLHEVVGHKGFSELFGYYYYDFLEEVYKRGSDEVRAAIDYQAARKGQSHHAGTDEYLAILTERVENTPEQRNILRRFCDFIREMLQRYNIYKSELTESDILSLIRRHHDAMVKRRSYDSYRSEAFRPFESAARKDGGYNDERVAFERYVRDMKRNPNLEGLHEGFHDFKRRMYGDVDYNKFRYRDYGIKGVKQLGDIPYYRKKDLDRALDLGSKRYTMPYIENLTGWRRDKGDIWLKSSTDILDGIKVYDYVYRTLRLHDAKRAHQYKELAQKYPHERTSEENEFLDDCRNIATIYDTTAKLDDIMYDWTLFKAYPEVKDMPVTFCNLKDRYAVYDVENKRLLVDKKGFADPKFVNELYLTMQHIIHDIEGAKMRPITKNITMSNKIQGYADALYNIYKMGEPRLGKREKYFPEVKRPFKMRYGVDLEDFMNKYPTEESFTKSSENFVWRDNNGTELRNYALNSAELENFLGGPIDLIKKVIDNSSRNNDDITLREAERLRGIVSDVPSYTVPEYEHLEGVRSINDIRSEFNDKYGAGSDYYYKDDEKSNEEPVIDVVPALRYSKVKRRGNYSAPVDEETKKRLKELSDKIDNIQKGLFRK